MKVKILSAVVGVGLVAAVLWDAFETIVQPRRVTRRVRLARLFYRSTWVLYCGLVSAISPIKRKGSNFAYYGPLSLLMLLGLWALCMLFGFALLHWAAGSALSSPEDQVGFLTDLYLSGTTLFTLGIGDVIPRSPLARALVVVEAGLGIAFLALVIGYLPSLNQSFSRREVSISLLDARAGSPPTAAEMLLRHKDAHGMEVLEQLLHEWERWSSEFLESHLSYPVLAYFRSQHDNQSWLAALTAVLDTSALLITGVEGTCQRQAELTFAMARHAVVDLAIVFGTAPHEPKRDRLSEMELEHFRFVLSEAGLRLRTGAEADQKLTELRRMYEPYVYSLSKYFRMTLPPWMFESPQLDNWQMSAWDTVRRRSRKRDLKHF